MAPLPTGRLSGQVAHRRGSMGGLLLQVPSRPDLAADAYSGAMELVLLLVVIGGLVAVAVTAGKTGKRRELVRAESEVAPVKKLAEEDVTALGVELQDLDIELAGHPLDEGEKANYPRALAP